MIILILLLAAVAFILFRTFRFKPLPEKEQKFDEVSIDSDKAVAALAELIKFKTVSNYDPTLEDNAEFEKLIDALPSLYPEVFNVCTMTRFPDRGLLFKWSGNDSSLNPGVLMAHYDVVPVNEELWTHPAFEGEIIDNVMWGRGTLDTKITVNGILFAANALIQKGFTPNRDLYFAFSGGEEVSGLGAVNIVNWFKENNITPEYVLDEGGGVVRDVFPGVKEECALIGIAEKGLMNLKFTVKSPGGHASAPLPHTPIGTLSKACTALENRPFKAHFTDATAGMFDTLGRRSTFLYRMIFANLNIFKPVLDLITKKSGGEFNALLRTTVAFTCASGSKAPNVIPPEANMVANLRLNPMDNVDSAVEYIKSVINDENVELTVMEGQNPPHISRTDVLGWDIVASAVKGTWRDALVAPYLMIQCSDSRHYDSICDRVYRFSAMDVTAEERKTIHGNDEHVRLEVVSRAVEFFTRVMIKS